MRCQHGIVFEGPCCPECGEEMTLHRFAFWDGPLTRVDYVWHCPHEDCQGEVSGMDEGEYVVPDAILKQYGDPAIKFVGAIEDVPVRLRPQRPETKCLFGGGGPSGRR